MSRPKGLPRHEPEAAAEIIPTRKIESRQPVAAPSLAAKQTRITPVSGETIRNILPPTVDPVGDFNQAVETLVSSRATLAQKRRAWKQLLDQGQLDQAIGELERWAANDPQKSESPAALGQAYMKKCATSQDVREQAILAMKADQTLETALNLDPSNWEARFTKAAGMAHWPEQLNKGREVIEQFRTLIQQQEAQPSQPEFAQSYVFLGDQYHKSGNLEYATQVWERGAAFFPNHAELKSKLASRALQP